MFIENEADPSKGWEAAVKELADYLPDLSKRGSGDDISVAGIVDMETIKAEPFLAALQKGKEEAEERRAREKEEREKAIKAAEEARAEEAARRKAAEEEAAAKTANMAEAADQENAKEDDIDIPSSDAHEEQPPELQSETINEQVTDNREQMER